MKRSFLTLLAVVPLLCAASYGEVRAQSPGDDEIVATASPPPTVSASQFSISEITNTFASMPVAQEVAFALIVALSLAVVSSAVQFSPLRMRGRRLAHAGGDGDDDDGARHRLSRNRVAGLPVYERARHAAVLHGVT